MSAARAALSDPAESSDLWPVAIEAGWPGMLISDSRGGAALGAFEALLIAEECGRRLAAVPLLGALPATLILNAASDPSLEACADGTVRPAYIPAAPGDDLDKRWLAQSPDGGWRGIPSARLDGDDVVLNGAVGFVPDAPKADVLIAVGELANGEIVTAAIPADTPGSVTKPLRRYDGTRSLGHVTFENARGRRLRAQEETAARAWYLAQSLLAAESLGTAESALEMSVQYAKDRWTFGRPIGSYQAIKHELTEIRRRVENARSLQYYAGWAAEHAPGELALAASAARAVAGDALDFATRATINIHGGIGATWEHDAQLLYRRAQLTRRLLGGQRHAEGRVASELIRSHRLTPGLVNRDR